MSFKLDMSKAYDRVSWFFLESSMLKLDFSRKWVGLIMSCVRIFSFFVLINGEPKGPIFPFKGLRWGDFFLLTYFYYALRALFVYYKRLLLRTKSRVFRFVEDSGQ